MTVEVRCSFCNILSEEAEVIVQKEESSICADCLNLVKEIVDEFSMGRVFDEGGKCSFCKKEHGGERMVFQGEKARICNLCIVEIEREMRDVKRGISKAPAKTKNQGRVSAKSRVREGISELLPYSVPHIECRVKLDGNESPFRLPDEVLKRVLREIGEIPVNRYPDPDATVLRERISSMAGFPSDGILVGNGSDELIEMLMRTFSGHTGRVLYPVPTFSMFRIIGISLGLEQIPVELDGRFDIDIKATLREIRRKNPDLIFLATPNNPTGNSFSDDRILEILKNSDGVVVVDEAYCDFSGKTFLPLIEEYENLIILRTMSKVGFAGIRLGILFGRSDLVSEVNKVRLPYNVNSLSQRVAEVVLENSAFVKENVQLIIRERERVYRGLKVIRGIEAFPSDANFILFRVKDADKVSGELIKRGVLIRNFNSPGRLENCLRVTIGTPEENDEFLKAVGEIIS